MVAYAVHHTGVREVIGLDVGEVESGAFWVEFIRSLKQRGLDGVRLAISDQHEGLKAAIAGCWAAVAALHRALLARHGDALPPRPARTGRRRLREVFNAEGYEQAEERVGHVLERRSP